MTRLISTMLLLFATRAVGLAQLQIVTTLPSPCGALNGVVELRTGSGSSTVLTLEICQASGAWAPIRVIYPNPEVPYFVDCLFLDIYNLPGVTDCGTRLSRPKLIMFGGVNPVVVLKGSTDAFYIEFAALDIISDITIGALTGIPAEVTINTTVVDGGSFVPFSDRSVEARFDVSASSAAVLGSYPISLSVSTANGTETNPSQFSLDVVSSLVTISPSNQSVSAGGSLTYSVTFSGPGVGQPITPACSIAGSPAGLSVAVSPSSVAATGGTTTATVSSVSGVRTATDYTLVCGGSATGGFIVNATANVHVN